MAINRRDIIEMLRDENALLKERNHQVSTRLARMQVAFRVLAELENLENTLDDQVSLDKLLYRVLELVMHACDIQHGSLLLLDEENDELEFVEVIGDTRDALINHRIKMDTGVVGLAISTGEAQMLDNVHGSKKWSSEVDDYLGFYTQALMCVPLQVDGRVLGAIEVVTSAGEEPFDANDLSVLSVAGRFASLVLKKMERLTLQQKVTS